MSWTLFHKILNWIYTGPLFLIACMYYTCTFMSIWSLSTHWLRSKCSIRPNQGAELIWVQYRVHLGTGRVRGVIETAPHTQQGGSRASTGRGLEITMWRSRSLVTSAVWQGEVRSGAGWEACVTTAMACSHLKRSNDLHESVQRAGKPIQSPLLNKSIGVNKTHLSLIASMRERLKENDSGWQLKLKQLKHKMYSNAL